MLVVKEEREERDEEEKKGRKMEKKKERKERQGKIGYLKKLQGQNCLKEPTKVSKTSEAEKAQPKLLPAYGKC